MKAVYFTLFKALFVCLCKIQVSSGWMDVTEFSVQDNIPKQTTPSPV